MMYVGRHAVTKALENAYRKHENEQSFAALSYAAEKILELPIYDAIEYENAGKLLADVFQLKPCQMTGIAALASLAKHLPLRCQYSPELCEGRKAAECWEYLLRCPGVKGGVKNDHRQKDGY